MASQFNTLPAFPFPDLLLSDNHSYKDNRHIHTSNTDDRFPAVEEYLEDTGTAYATMTISFILSIAQLLFFEQFITTTVKTVEPFSLPLLAPTSTTKTTYKAEVSKADEPYSLTRREKGRWLITMEIRIQPLRTTYAINIP